MRERTRPGGRPRRPGPPDRIRATGTRHRRPLDRRAPDPTPRAAWAFALISLVLGLGFIAFIVLEGNGRRIGVVVEPTATVTPAPTLTPGPTEALAVTGDGPAGPRMTTAPTHPADSTHRPARGTAPPRATASPAPTPPIRDLEASPRPLTVSFPEQGEQVVSPRINVFGRAPGGAVIVRDLPDGGTQESVARPDGLWLMRVDLDPGTNDLVFRVAGSTAVPLVVRVTYRPR